MTYTSIMHWMSFVWVGMLAFFVIVQWQLVIPYLAGSILAALFVSAFKLADEAGEVSDE